MPRFDGTGPQGQGPMTGRGEGHCALVLPESGQSPYGYAGLQGTPVRLGAPAARPALRTRFARWPRPAMQRGRAFGRGRGHGAGRGRGRRFARW
ncbi:MAG: DUF5320 domain-containing protein [Anaerolineae bacterium]|nr:DUF5320 domain-containing protein [Anaerolineae bacterium]